MKKFCDEGGRLSLEVAAAVAAENIQELVICSKGLVMERCSWKMDVEEPTASGVISAALNLKNAAALRTTELTAMSVLSGEITRQKSTNLAHEVAFLTVKEKVVHQLDVIADDPEFVELFDCVINLGADSNSYVRELLYFGQKFVDQKLRQLRLNAFAIANKMPVECPRSKLAA